MEIYPTCVRQSGIAIEAMTANIFGIFHSYIVYLGTEYDVRYPYMILGILCFVGFIATLLLPETLHHKLPNTLEEAKTFGKTQV
jgi:hypothetical protein